MHMKNIEVREYVFLNGFTLYEISRDIFTTWFQNEFSRPTYSNSFEPMVS